MAHRHDRIDAGLAQIRDHAPQRDPFGADRHAAEVNIEIDAGHDLSRTRTQSRADLLPVVAITLPDRLTRNLYQFLIGFGQLHFDSSLSPNRISCAVSAPSPALRLAAAIAAAACG